MLYNGIGSEVFGLCYHTIVLQMDSCSIGWFSEAGLLEWTRFVIFRVRSRERSQRTSRPISEQALLHAVYNSGSWT